MNDLAQHDPIGLGEDGPIHQPVEHLAALRGVPNLLLFRPADAVETGECWQLALAHKARPSLLALTPQNLPTLRPARTEDNLSARGACEISPASDAAKVTLLTAGSEVSIAIEAQKILAAQDRAARVVSMPCWALFEEQPATYRDAMRGPGTVRVAIEAAGPMGWERYIGPSGASSACAASAPAHRPEICTGISASQRKPPRRPR
jgi:transketolase